MQKGSLGHDVSLCTTDCHWLASSAALQCHLFSPLPLCPSTPSLWAHVCFCSCLQSAWLTMMILTRRGERSRLARQIASKQSALSLCANSGSCLSLSFARSLCRHLAISPSLLSPLRLSVCLPRGWKGVGETCVCEDWQWESDGEGLLWSLSSDLQLGRRLGTWKHTVSQCQGDISAPSSQQGASLCSCVCVYIYVVYVNMCL